MRAAVWFVAVLVIACGESRTTPVDALVGTDVPCVASLAALPATYSFGSVSASHSSAPADFAITNVGTCATTPLAVMLAGTGAQEFTLGGTTCTNRRLTPAESCTASVRFTPTLLGTKTATLRVDGADAPLLVPIDGSGTSFHTWLISSGAGMFPATPVHRTSSPLDFRISNIGGFDSAGIPSVALAGTDDDQFTIASNSCSAVLPAGDSCVVSIAFQPTTTGSKSAVVLITDPRLGQLAVAVSGTALPGLQLVPSPHDFGAVRIGTSSSAKRFTLTNVTTVPSSASLAVSLTGADAAQFAIAGDTCSSTMLPAGGACDIDVVFQPTAVGAMTAVVRANDPTLGMVDVPISGTGVTAAHHGTSQ